MLKSFSRVSALIFPEYPSEVVLNRVVDLYRMLSFVLEESFPDSQNQPASKKDRLGFSQMTGG